MVKLSSNNKSNINVKTESNNKSNINVKTEGNNVTADVNGNSQRAKSWAVGEGLIEGQDYSSKYYAQQAKQSENIATEAVSNIDTAVEDAQEYAQTAQEMAEYIVNNAPTVTVEQTSTGATVTATDLQGTTTAVILNGAKGDKGDTGAQGEQGPQGLQGIQGEKGEKGDKGDKGDTGSKGDTGAQGPKGDKGDTGSQGPQGLQGEQGPQGAQGAQGPQGVSIVSNELYSTSGLYDTYRQTFSDGSHFDYVVKNGADGGYTLPIASSSTLGGIKVGNNLSIDANGVLSATASTTVDQTYSPSSANAQSGIAINGAKFIKDTASNGTRSIGVGSISTNSGNFTDATLVGNGTSCYCPIDKGILIGGIQIGNSGTLTNSIVLSPERQAFSGGVSNSFYVNSKKIYDLSTKLFEDSCISSNIARTSAIPTESTVSGWGFTKNTGTVTSVNNVSPISGNVTLSIPTTTSDLTNDSGFITSIPTATSSTLGMVQPDNTTITIDGNGIISSNVASRNVGEIIQSTIPLTDAGLHLLDGSLLAYGSYQAFIDHIADLYDSGNYDDIFETEANWQSSVTTYGVCGKFVYDSVNQTVRLPKITGFTEATIDPTVLGDLVEAGLPNITGYFGGTVCLGSQHAGAFDKYGNENGIYGNASASSNYISRYDFDASRSSTIYGNSNTVQPQAIKVLYYIVIANTVKTAIQVDIDEIATDLNGKAGVDLANVNDSGSSLGASWAMPSSTSIDLTLGSSGTGYIAPSEGYFSFVSGNSGSYPKNVELENLTSNISSSAQNSANNGWLRCCLPAKKGDQVKIWYQNLDFESLKFVYAQGSESEAN